jgi:hypothetical protein
MKNKKTQPRVEQKSRRRFTKTLAAALVAAPVVAATTSAQTTPAPAATPAQQPTPPKPSPEAEAYADVARARFGSQVSEEEFARIKRDLEGNVRTSERLRAFKLKNSDEPDSVFSA